MPRYGRAEARGIADRLPAEKHGYEVIYRFMGDRYLLIEYGDIVMDVNLRIRVHSLQQAMEAGAIPAIEETNPGVRSLLLRYNPEKMSCAELVATLKDVEAKLPPAESVTVKSRLVRLPLAFNDRWCREAVGMYAENIRPAAPYIPDNVEFVARCNGLAGASDVGDYLGRSEIIVIGLGDVYLGAPCAIPLDPRYRLCAPKYNPARTFTPEGAVGIGGACICIYPMESPGGYQLIGRTVPIWNTQQKGPLFREAPWLLRNFDRIAFDLVSEDDLERARKRFLAGECQLAVEDGVFSIKQYNSFVASVERDAGAFRKRQADAIGAATIGF